MDGAKRKLSKSVVKKDVITVDMYDKHFDANNVYSLRIITISLLCYSGFLSSEVLNLMRSDIEIYTTHMATFIEQSKTDIYRYGSWLLISRTASKLCPVSNLELYLSLADISCDSSDYVFRNLTKTHSGYILRTANKP